jgi:spore maturation protein CgeB
MYRVMCAGGLYLTNYVKDLETMFRINSKDEPVRINQDLVVYYDENDLIEKLDFLLLHDDVRKQIAKNGQECVIQQHTFQDRLNQMLKTIEGEQQ